LPGVAEVPLFRRLGGISQPIDYVALASGRSVASSGTPSKYGHASAIETLDTYGHMWPESEDRTRQAVDVAFSLEISGKTGDSLGTVQTI
jgi:hypothetical protein